MKLSIFSDPTISLGISIRKISTLALKVTCTGILAVVVFKVGEIGSNLGFITREMNKMW